MTLLCQYSTQTFVACINAYDVIFVWDQKCEESFNRLKELLTIAPILKITDPEKDFIVCTDACNEGLGGVLIQEGDAIAYESRKLKTHKIILQLMN